MTPLKIGDKVFIYQGGKWSTRAHAVNRVLTRLTTRGNVVSGYEVRVGTRLITVPKSAAILAEGQQGPEATPLSLFDPPPSIPTEVPAHANDPDTSRHASALSAVKRGHERHRLLMAFVAASGGLTDQEAGRVARIEGDYDDRRHCTILRKHRLIEPTGETRPSTRGNPSMVCRITDEGRRVLNAVSGRE